MLYHTLFFEDKFLNPPTLPFQKLKSRKLLSSFISMTHHYSVLSRGIRSKKNSDKNCPETAEDDYKNMCFYESDFFY